MKQVEPVDLKKFAAAKIRTLYLKEGGRYLSSTVRNINYGCCETGNRHVIRRFRDFFLRRGSWSPNRGDYFPAEIHFVDSTGEDTLFLAFPMFPEQNGRAYQSALNVFSNDLCLQTAQRAKQLRASLSTIRKLDVFALGQLGGLDTVWPLPAPKPSDIPAALHALEHLDRRAFTFGEHGGNVLFVFEHADGKLSPIRLRPPLYKNAKAASRMVAPPLPQPLWSWVYGLPPTKPTK